MSVKYYPPVLGQSKFNCPSCKVYALQKHSGLYANAYRAIPSEFDEAVQVFNAYFSDEWATTKCEHCEDMAVWHKGKLLFPCPIFVDPPNEDLDDDIKSDYMEAADVYHRSPRAAAALLRLALQKLCKQLNGKGENINEDIRSFKEKGLSEMVINSMDSLRITGNHAVHPGQLDLKEDKERVAKLFGFINLIAQKLISEPREVNDFYNSLPRKSPDVVKKGS